MNKTDIIADPKIAKATNAGNERVGTRLIQPTRGWAAVDLRELWHHHELIYYLTWRDIKVRYKQTIIGAAWAVLQPALTMVVFSVLFGRLIGVSTGNVPYPVFAYAGLLVWTFFATAVNQSGTSLVANSNLISKVYFPRLVIPIAGVLGGLLDFGISFVFFMALLLFYRMLPGVLIFAVPFFLFLLVLVSLAVGLWLSALDVKYRDVRYVIPFLIQFWLFITPVAYPTSLIPDQWRILYGLNPLVGIIEGFRWALLGQETVSWDLILVSIFVTLFLLFTGLFYFRRMEREFVDVI